MDTKGFHMLFFSYTALISQIYFKEVARGLYYWHYHIKQANDPVMRSLNLSQWVATMKVVKKKKKKAHLSLWNWWMSVKAGQKILTAAEHDKVSSAGM